MSRLHSRVAQAASSTIRAVFQSLREQPRRSRLRPRLGLEALEDRTVPAAFSPTSFADDFSVNTLRGAIVAANGNGQDDVITLQAGVYNLSLDGAVWDARCLELVVDFA